MTFSGIPFVGLDRQTEKLSASHHGQCKSEAVPSLSIQFSWNDGVTGNSQSIQGKAIPETWTDPLLLSCLCSRSLKQSLFLTPFPVVERLVQRCLFQVPIGKTTHEVKLSHYISGKITNLQVRGHSEQESVACPTMPCHAMPCLTQWSHLKRCLLLSKYGAQPDDEYDHLKIHMSHEKGTFDWTLLNMLTTIRI